MARGTGRGIASLLLNMYSQGLLGGLPAEERQAKLAWFKAKSGGLEELGEISRKPVWSKLTPEMETDPAAEKVLPGQRRMEVGEKAYRVPAGKPREEMVGPTYGEAGAWADIADKALGRMITQKAGPGMMRYPMGKVMPPEAREEALGGVMFPTEPFRRLEEFGRITKEKGLSPEQREAMEGIGEDVKKIIFGVKEKEKQPPVGPPKPRPGVLGQYDEWKKDPENLEKSYGDFVEWKARTTSEARIKALDKRARADPTYKKALDIAFKVVMERVEEESMLGLEVSDIEIIDRLAVATDDLYQKLKGEKPVGRKDVLGIDSEIKRIMEERGQ